MNGRLIELDATRDTPIDLGSITPEDNWVDHALPIIEKQMKSYASKNIKSTLFVLMPDQLRKYLELADIIASMDRTLSENVAKLLTDYFVIRNHEEIHARKTRMELDNANRNNHPRVQRPSIDINSISNELRSTSDRVNNN